MTPYDDKFASFINRHYLPPTGHREKLIRNDCALRECRNERSLARNFDVLPFILLSHSMQMRKRVIFIRNVVIRGHEMCNQKANRKPYCNHARNCVIVYGPTHDRERIIPLHHGVRSSESTVLKSEVR